MIVMYTMTMVKLGTRMNFNGKCWSNFWQKYCKQGRRNIWKHL